MFDSYVAFHARLRPSAPAVATRHGQVSFETLDADVDRTAAVLLERRLPEGEAVAVELADGYLHWVLVLALARLGIASAPASESGCRPRISGDEGSSSGAILFTAADLQRLGAGPRPRLAAVRRDPNALARVLKSSGTTGEEKRVGMSWRVIDAGIRNALVAYGSPEGRWLASTGIDTILGLVVTLACWASGNCAILGQGGKLAPADLAQLRPSLIALVPDQLRRLLDDLPADAERWPLRIVSGGGPVPPALARRTRLHLTANLRSVYGAAETGAVALADLDLLEAREAAAGYLLPGVEVGVLDENGHALPPGELGRIRIRSDRVVDHYLDDADRSARSFQQGWFHPGDLGRLGEDGLLVIEGRVDDLMNLAGHKVLPYWVEQAALACPGIRDAGAFSLTDDNGLECCWLALVTEPGREVSPQALSQALGRQLRWLSEIQWITMAAIPRNIMGKIDRPRLRQIGAAWRARHQQQPLCE
jgi:acyl-coenzyme A synthetase/AMP-(fatty) acid ligase